VLRAVVARGVRVAAAGVALGLAVALVVVRYAADLLFDVPPRDPATFGAVLVLLLAVAAVAGLVPGWRAARVDPTEALRGD
jgi:ABC-type lipoprotein release transport system permease subunit